MTKYSKLLFIIFILVSPIIFSQTILLPQEEAPLSIFSIELGDADVDLYLAGSWETDLRGGFGYSWNSIDENVKVSSFPGMTSGFQLTHKPDILISLWLMDRYFFEASFIDNYELNTILFGYEAVDENFLRSVRIGNTDIGFGNYSWLQIPEASTDSMGGMVLFKNDKSEHQFMLRFDPAEMQVKNFIGKYEVDPVRLDLTDYIEGRYFILPDDNVEDLKVYIEDSSGIYTDGNHQYRLANSNDAIISAEEGIVFFREALNVRAAVHYTKGGSTVGDAALGINALAGDISDRIDISTTRDFLLPAGSGTDFYLEKDLFELKLTIGSETALLLYEPGVFSPFEMLSIYSLPYLIPASPSLFKGTLADISLSTGENLSLLTTFEEYSVRVLYSGDSYRNPANRYPFAESIETDTIIYEPDKLLSGSPPDKELLFQRLLPTGNYYLGDNILDGSVAVNVNGFDEYRYTFDPDSGTVNFMFPVPADAQIEISYRTRATSGMSGDLLMGLGSRFNFSDKFLLETGAGLRWNVIDSEYTEKPGEATGSILGTAGLSYTGDNLDFKLDTGISIHSPNTTGILRLAGMNRNGFDIPVSADFLYPAAPSNVTTVTRGNLYYKDYHDYDSSGSSSLKDYNWALPADQVYAYADGGRTGPYIAGTDSEIPGNAAVFEYDLGNSEWTGGRIPLTLGSQALDLSETQSISLKWKHITVADNVTIYLRVGKLAEDLDSDGILDEEISKYESGFNFNDGSFLMKVGLAPDSSSGNDQIDTEDLDGNDILDAEGSDLVLTMKEDILRPDFTEPGSTWETLNLKLSPADREFLKAVTGLEIIIVDEGGGGSSGRLLVGDIIFSGSSFVIKPDTGQIATVREINELYSTASGSLLSTDFPEINIFSSGTGAQNVAEMNWDAAGTWEATTFTEAVNLTDYNKISFYMKTPASDPDKVTFTLTNPSGEGISLSFEPVESNNWVKYTIDYRNGNLTADEVPQSTTWIKRDANSASVNRLSLSAECSNGGSLLLDEVHLEDPVVGVSGAVSSIFNYRKSGNIFDINGTSLLSNFNFSNSSRVVGQNFASGFTNNSDSTIYTASNLSITLLAMRINGNLDLQWQDIQLYSSPGVSFTIPFFDNRILINDSYSEVNMPLAESVHREESIMINPGIFSLKVLAGTTFNGQSLTRNWGLGTETRWDSGSLLSTDIDFNMTSTEDPYEGLDSMEKLGRSYRMLLPGDTGNDRSTKIKISPYIRGEIISHSIEESLTSSISGLDERVLDTQQILSVNTELLFNPDSLEQWELTPGYKKVINSRDNAHTDINFFTDTKESVLNLGTQVYYFTGVPLWEIFYPDFYNQFSNNTAGLRNAEYEPEFSLLFSRLTGSRWVDILLPSIVNFNVSRNLDRDFDSVTDQLNINLETRATALNVFGNLGSRPLFGWYQTEEITNVLSIGGDFRSYMTELFYDRAIDLNYSLYLNFIIDQDRSIDFESGNNWSWLPLNRNNPATSYSIREEDIVLNWNSSTTVSYNWQVKPSKTIHIPLLPEKEGQEAPYFGNSEKLTVSADNKSEQQEFSLTLTAGHSTDLIISDTGIISLFAGIGWDQKSITAGDVITKYYLVGVEAGISAKLTF